MAANVVPSLGSGWVASPSEKADLLMAHFCAAEVSQSALYAPGTVASLQALVQEFGHDELAIVTAMTSCLTKYFSRYFDEATVEITTTVGDNGGINLKLYAHLTENGKDYTLGKLIEMNNKLVTKIATLNN